MTVSVAATWTASYAMPGTYGFPPPAMRPVQIPVTNTAGDWLFAVVSVRQPIAGQGVTITVADDAHNWWEPIGAPNTDSPAAGVTRTMVWCAPAARAAANIQVAATEPYISMAIVIADVAGMQPWMQLAAITGNYALAATSLTLSTGAPSAQALLIAAGACDAAAGISGGAPGVAWTQLPIMSVSNGVDHTADMQMFSGWQVTSGAASATWGTITGTLDYSGVIAGVLVSAAAPSQPNAAWPVVITEIAPGAGSQTPPSQLSWTALSPRALSMQVQQGRQYTLSQLQAGQGTLEIDNPDGALIPPGTGSFAGIDSGTPVRQRVIIPAIATPHYVAYSGYFKRWPWAMEPDLLRGKTQAEITDIWGYANGILNSMAINEYQLDDPYALWPLNDPAGSSGASNLAPGNSNPLALVLSKYGTGGATQAWAQNSTGGLTGAASARVTRSGKSGGAAGMFGQTLPPGSTALNTNGYGYALVCQDGNYPPISGGVTIECWFQVTTNGGNINGFTAAVSGNLFTFNGTYVNGDPVVMSVAPGFSIPGGFNTSTVYYVISVSGSTCQLAATPGGPAITVTGSGGGFWQITTPWNPAILSARNVNGRVAEIQVRNTDGAILLNYRTASGTVATTVIDSSHDYRNIPGMTFVSLAFSKTSYQVIIGAFGAAAHTGSFSSALPSGFTELCIAGIQDRSVQGYAWSGFVTLAAVYPSLLAPVRVYSHYGVTAAGDGGEAACDRVDRILEYAGLTGRRWIGQQVTTLEADLVTSGQDIGGQAAATSLSNIAASTLPAMLYVAPTGDMVYAAKLYAWNQPVRWTLGDNVSGGEIPFRPEAFATDYDPARVVADVQLTQLDTQSVTIPSGVMASTTMAAVAAASAAQYGGQPYQQTGYLNADWSAAYTAGSSLTDLANWIANIYAKPGNRVQAVTVEAAANAANASWKAWQFWAGASVGDMVAVNVRPPTAATSPLISLVARITQTQRQMQFSQAGTQATITCVLDFAPEYNALICDDATRGLLNGKNVLAW